MYGKHKRSKKPKTISKTYAEIYKNSLLNLVKKTNSEKNRTLSQLIDIKDYNFIYSFTTSHQGYYEICMINYDTKYTIINYNLKYGIAAKDYSSIAKTKDLKPIDVEIEKLVEKTSALNYKSNYIRANEQLTQSMLDKVSSRLFFFAEVMIAVMVLIGIAETFYLKKFLQKRKII